MKDKQAYFSNFKDKEDYVTYSTSYWNYAFVTENEWIDMGDEDERTWIKDFLKRFVSTIDPNETVTIYECTVNNG